MALTQMVYDRVREDIQNACFSVNEFLNESQLAERYEVSKAPVRAALLRLCQEGLLISYPRKGYLITAVSAEEFQTAQHMRWLLEGYALELALTRATDEALAALDNVAAAPCTLSGNQRFHLSVAALSGSRSLTDAIARLLGTVESALGNRIPQGTEAQAAHIAIAQALKNRDIQAAKCALSEDLELN